ncbi:MAG: Re/Si-specific NAD(P)(+) transhydrogenase subunit alpha [Spirochaetia bacterium]|nr:Re/Si-specific NAD(P)(+) transhydrogenase subunit alpha [Spirochaetota bacterium]MCX8096923.1 Re/Si-specific NAD(P)(+) transhydrogenase subunit alpha [Spirochaetota bacterium]MDW8112436.1 Re/Si-specific NAD(P)(+) transhydrogenase subunit alpha [Spirochaetia bacterium]
MILGVMKETFPNEKRVSLIPQVVSSIKKLGLEVYVEKGAGEGAYYSDQEYETAGARVVSRSEILDSSSIITYVRAPGADTNNISDIQKMKKDTVVIGMTEPLANPEIAKMFAERGVISFSLELIPRITRAQSMDVLSSMATIAGYKAVLIAGELLPKVFPMFMTAAGNLMSAKVFVIGAGVAGLQAIATAKRLGAVVEAYDVRPEVKEQVQSVGGKFIELGLETQNASDKSGYAKAMSEEFYQKQREMMMKVLEYSDVVISTASVPGKKAPILITKEMVERMKKGSVIIDLAAEKGGNCELTKPGEVYDYNGVKIAGLVNLPSTVPVHASQMYSNNVKNFLSIIVKDGKLNIDLSDEIISGTLVTKDGEVVHPLVKKALGQS